MATRESPISRSDLLRPSLDQERTKMTAGGIKQHKDKEEQELAKARHPSTWGDETAGYSGANQDAANCASAFPLSSCEGGQRFEDARRFPTI
ncbi:hypothetical protein Trydic_g19859 [Trypoxylus dichotomus]